MNEVDPAKSSRICTRDEAEGPEILSTKFDGLKMTATVEPAGGMEIVRNCSSQVTPSIGNQLSLGNVIIAPRLPRDACCKKCLRPSLRVGSVLP